MKKSLLYLLIIISVLAVMGMLSFNNGKIGIIGLQAYDPAYLACATSGSYYTPYTSNVVNAMDYGTAAGCIVVPGFPKGPPNDSSNDVFAWLPNAPFPQIPPVLNIETSPPNLPTSGTFGINLLKAVWVGNSAGCEQSAYLPGTMFENEGSDISDTFNSRTDWSKYGYIRFNMYCNEGINGGGISGNGLLSQTASLFDGVVTKTVGPVTIRTQLAQPFKYFLSASLNFLANSFERPNTWTAVYFDLTNIEKFIINATGVDYLTRPGSQITMYYDLLTLGAKDEVPAFGGRRLDSLESGTCAVSYAGHACYRIPCLQV
jgi:hypothetical protein